jgi:putative hydrolase of the HAD superfamily
MPIRGILFDLDNTLLLEDEATFASVRRACELAGARGLDTEGLLTAVRQAAAARWETGPVHSWADRMGIWWGEALWGEFAGDAPELRALRAFVPGYRAAVWRDALAAIGVSDDALSRELDAAYRAARRAEQLVDPEAEAVLADLARDHALALITNGAPDVQREKLAGTSLARHFRSILISVELGIAKPDPRIFGAALDDLGLTPGEAAMVGDSLARDVAGAKAAGVRAIWIDRGIEKPPAGPRPEPDAQIRTLGDLRPVLARLDATAPDGASPRGSRAPRPARAPGASRGRASRRGGRSAR